jgi:hypothetical protein
MKLLQAVLLLPSQIEWSGIFFVIKWHLLPALHKQRGEIFNIYFLTTSDILTNTDGHQTGILQ